MLDDLLLYGRKMAKPSRYKMKIEKYAVEFFNPKDLDSYIVFTYHMEKKLLTVGSRSRYRADVIRFLFEVVGLAVLPEPTFHQNMNIRYCHNLSINDFEAVRENIKALNGVKFRQVDYLHKLM